MSANTIGPYQIISELGKGGMGIVYEAQHSGLGRRAAVKILHSEHSSNHDAVQRFFNEAKAAATIEHPGIITVFEFGFDGNTGSAYIAMELLRGETLRARLDRQPTLSEADTLRIGRGIATALAAAHHAGIVHRDLKPDNVFLVPDPDVVGGERVKLLDFGIAKLGDHLRQKGYTTKSGVFMGTPAYASPEQCDGAKSLGAPSDLYALGCILYHCVAGRPPFVADGVGRLIAAHLYDKPNPPTLYAPNLSPGFTDLLMGLLSKAPDQRPGDAHAVADQLRALGATSQEPRMPGMSSNPDMPRPVVGAVPTTLSGAAREASSSTQTSSKRGWLIVAGLVVIVAAVGSVVAVVASQGNQAEPDASVTRMADASESRPVNAAVDARPPADAAAADAGVDAAVKTVKSSIPKRCRFNNLVDLRTKRELREALARVRSCKSVLPAARFKSLQKALLSELGRNAKPTGGAPKP